MPSISIVTTSPSLVRRGGLRGLPTPGGGQFSRTSQEFAGLSLVTIHADRRCPRLAAHVLSIAHQDLAHRHIAGNGVAEDVIVDLRGRDSACFPVV